MAERENVALDVDDFNDADSAIGELNDGSSYESLRSSIFAYQEENGRRYHALSEGKYMLPNDEPENDRLDLQNHLFKLTLDGKQALSPGADTASRVLDIGTGTGIWAIEYADEHPHAEVVGVDLSPIQPSFVPPNLSFEIDDVEKEWTWSRKFGFIFSRMMAGSFKDVSMVLKQAYDNLEPGGYLEFQDNDFPMRCDDDSLPESSALYRWSRFIIEASIAFQRPINVAHTYKELMEEAGFENVVETQFKWPQNRWPKDKKHKEIGMFTQANVDEGLEGLSMALFTRGLGWSKEEVIAFATDVRKDIRNIKMHGYWPIYVVYGRKPKASETPKA